MIPAQEPDQLSPAEHVRRQILSRQGRQGIENTVNLRIEDLRRAKHLAASLGLDLSIALIVKGRPQ